MTQNMLLQQQVIAIIHQGRQTEREAEATLTTAEREAQGAIDAWVLKDTIIHANIWKENLAENLADSRTGRDVTKRADFLAHNDVMFQRFQAASWEEVNAYCDGVVAALITEIEQQSDEALYQPQLYPWMQAEETIITEVIDNCMTHPFEHLAAYYLERGDTDSTLGLYTLLDTAIRTFYTSPRVIAAAQYNQACAYAKMNRGDLAVPLLQSSFAMNPALVEWSKQDTDLDSIRAEPDVQALYP